jgi:NADPH:quinone reductase-like Zn-dependent oxidoreductase
MTQTETATPMSSDNVPTTMRAATYHRYGEPDEVVTVTEVAVPRPGPADVLVRVRAASVNALDWHYVTGLPMFARASLGLRRPHRSIPGADVAGTVVAVGQQVTRFRVGDEVFGEVAGGAFAEYVAAPADWLVARPDGVPAEEAATLGVAAETALQGLRDWGGLQDGQTVLVNGASGGVGSFAVQIAKALGASHVTAVCSTANVETARRIGADLVVDYRTEEMPRDRTYDVLFDNAGNWPLRTCAGLLSAGGTYVMVTSPKSRWLHPLPRLIANPAYFGIVRGRRSAGFKVAKRSTANLELLADLAARGIVRPVMDRRFTLDEAPEALRLQGEFHARGKSVILP